MKKVFIQFTTCLIFPDFSDLCRILNETGMIQDINPHLFQNQFLETNEIDGNDYIFFYKGNTLLLKKNGEGFELPQKKNLLLVSAESIFLFSLNHHRCFLVPECAENNEDLFTFQEVSFFRTLPQKEIAWAGIVGYQLMVWYENNHFCGKCGGKTVTKKDERAIRCSVCGNTVYPKISPAIIVAILCRDKILLAHNANFQNSYYSLVAGYADIGESLEEAVAREVKEEVGICVRNIRYYKSQPWPFSGSMMIGFIADADDTQPIQTDGKEITDAAWYTRGHLPKHPPSISIAGEMIEKFEKSELI